MEGKQYGGGFWYRGAISSVSGGYSVQMCHTISMEKAHHQYGGGYAVWTCHINTEEGVQYRTTKTAQGLVGSWQFVWGNDILQTILLEPRFHPTVVESRCQAEIPLRC